MELLRQKIVPSSQAIAARYENDRLGTESFKGAIREGELPVPNEALRRLRKVQGLSLIAGGLRRVRASQRFIRHISSNGKGPHEHDPLAALEAELTRRVGADDPSISREHELSRGRTYLVTGCAGFIGSHLVEALNARGCSVVGVDAFIDNYPRAAKERNLKKCARRGDLEFVELDLAEAPLGPLMQHVDGVFHLAARPGVRTSWGRSFATCLRDNVLVTQRVFEAAVEHGIRVVYASSSSVYGDAAAYPVREDSRLAPVSPYGVTKLASEALAGAFARSHGLDAVGLRYFTVYGPRQRPDMAFARVFRCLEESRPFRMLGYGRQTREFTYVGDAVDATLAAMERAPSGQTYNVGGGSEISLLDSIALCEQIVGRPLDVEPVPAVAGDARRTSAQVTKAEVELGWRPTTSLDSGLLAQARDAAGMEEWRSRTLAMSY
jgi:UDP-glucuronate 4-epimerase